MSVKVSEFESEQPNADSEPHDGAPELDEAAAFQAELVRAMQGTAGLERARIGEDAERRRQEHIDSVRVREATDANRMRDLAAEDMKAIDAWFEGETNRLELERARRAAELNDDLETSLALHGSQINDEIERVEAAIAAYRAEVDAFFEGLDRETDPVAIAQRAARRPVFPALDAILATGADESASDVATDSTGETGPTLVGVMDPEAEAEPVESWVSQPETYPEPEGNGVFDAVDAVDEDITSAEPAEPVAATATASSHSSVGSILGSVPVLRPMAWLWRDAHNGDRSNRDD